MGNVRELYICEHYVIRLAKIFKYTINSIEHGQRFLLQGILIPLDALAGTSQCYLNPADASMGTTWVFVI